MKTFVKDRLYVRQFDTRAEMGAAAAQDAARTIRDLLLEKEEISVIFAAAPSQNDFLQALATDPSVDFTRINAFHMDEYIGLPADAPQGFGNFLRDRMFSLAPFKSVQYLNGQADDPQAECERYASLLNQQVIDIVFMGIGENAHIAFNDPGEADFNDPCDVKVVTLDQKCRNQQVNDGCFDALDKVPTHALSLTVPALLRGQKIFCIVPAPTKAQAVHDVLTQAIDPMIPATILRTHPNATMYLDADSSALLKMES